MLQPIKGTVQNRTQHNIKNIDSESIISWKRNIRPRCC